MMKKISFSLIFSLSLLLAGNLFAQTRQNQAALQQVEMEIRGLESELSRIDTAQTSARIKTLLARFPDGVLRDPLKHAAIQGELAKYRAKLKADNDIFQDVSYRLNELYTQRVELKNLPINNAIDEKTPKELRNLEKRRRFNSLQVRSGEVQLSRQELALEKLNSTQVYSNGVQGYKVLFWNQDRYKCANFIVTSIDGIDEQPAYLKPGEKYETYLLPGVYKTKIEISGRPTTYNEVGVKVRTVRVDGVDYHAYVIQPAR